MTDLSQRDDDTLFLGFEKARRIMQCHTVRARTKQRLEMMDFVVNTRVTAVHVDITDLADRNHLTAFDCHGRRISYDTLHIDEPNEYLQVAPEFDHDFT